MPSIPIGQYEITAELPGFQTQIRSGVTLLVDDNLRADFTLGVGQSSESVTVTGDVSSIQTGKVQPSELRSTTEPFWKHR